MCILLQKCCTVIRLIGKKEGRKRKENKRKKLERREKRREQEKRKKNRRKENPSTPVKLGSAVAEILDPARQCVHQGIQHSAALGLKVPPTHLGSSRCGPAGGGRVCCTGSHCPQLPWEKGLLPRSGDGTRRSGAQNTPRGSLRASAPSVDGTGNCSRSDLQRKWVEESCSSGWQEANTSIGGSAGKLLIKEPLGFLTRLAESHFLYNGWNDGTRNLLEIWTERLTHTHF